MGMSFGGGPAGPTGPAGGVLSGTYPNPGLANPLTVPGNITMNAQANVLGLLLPQAGIQVSGGFVDESTVGKGLAIAEGANAKQGVATLVAGTVTVANTSVTANSRIFLTAQSLGGTQGILAVTARVAGTSFTITSSNAADTSVVGWEIFEPG